MTLILDGDKVVFLRGWYLLKIIFKDKKGGKYLKVYGYNYLININN